MWRPKLKITLVMLLTISLLASCAPASTPTPTPTPAPFKTKITYEQALEQVRTMFPAATYMTNDYLPTEPVIGPTSETHQKIRKVRVGMPWVMNDEEAPFYNALALGYYQEEGLEVELVPGGPGVDHLKTLGGRALEIAIVASGGGIPRAVASVTPNPVVAVGALLKGWPYSFFTISKELMAKPLVPSDLKGKTVAVQSPTAGGDLYLNIMLDKYGIPRQSVNVINAGSDLSPLLVGTAQFYSAWVVNQPRQAEQNGFQWNALMYRDWVTDQYADVIAVRQETLLDPDGQDMVRRFLRATYRGLRYLLDHPEESAEFAVAYITKEGGSWTKEQALWRFKQQAGLITGGDQSLMGMDPVKWDQLVATFVQYEVLQLK